MKLSIQYLQKANNSGAPNVKELTANVAKTLVEQIDHLSKIASDFSQFAHIGNPRNEVLDLHELLSSLTSLYGPWKMYCSNGYRRTGKMLVYADKTQLNRLFTNLLQNALEACHGQETCVISLVEELKDDQILIRISDNGEGIPEQMRTKIFIPNFTTKSSGTGLGLAMSKTIVEQAKGKIWFETTEDSRHDVFCRITALPGKCLFTVMPNLSPFLMKNKIRSHRFYKGIFYFSIVYVSLFPEYFPIPLFSKAINFGGTGIHTFLFASGYGLFLSHLQKPLPYREFLKKRFTKIYIPYILVVIGCGADLPVDSSL